MENKKTFFVSTPIYYVNAKPHLGHAYTSMIADIFTRFNRIMGRDSFMLTGTDEHGDKIAQVAEKEGLTPQKLADYVSAEFKAMLPDLCIEPEQFIRTTDQKHKVTVQRFLQKVYDNGDIYFGEYGGHYCYGCERFYTEKELEDGLCPQHQVKPTYISEKNYFFRMSKYQDWLKQHILKNPGFIRPERYKNEVLALLDSGALEDLCISRPKSRLTWGIELPFDNNYVCYVWFDALVNYISALEWPDGEAFKKYWPSAQHIIAKDILKPHAIFWPTMLKAAGIKPFQHLNVHGYWLVRDTKMSKSLGNVISPLDIAKRYGVDAFRYFVLREMHFGSDASFSEEAIAARINADLANDLGNLFSRVLSMNSKYFDSTVPEPAEYNEEELALHSLAEDALRNFQELFENIKFSNALEALWELVRALNKYIDTAAPWTLFKEQNTVRLRTVMYTLLESMRKIALHLWPVMPQAAEKMLEQLGQKFNLKTCRLETEASFFGGLKPGTMLASASNIFPRLELPKTETDRNKKDKTNNNKEVENKTDMAASISFNDFQKLDLRVGTILEAEQVPKADKLLCFKVNVGEEQPRIILSGIAEFFKPEDLKGTQVIVVANLPPRKIRGIESQGMLLTAEDDSGLSLLRPGEERKPGSKIS